MYYEQKPYNIFGISTLWGRLETFGYIRPSDQPLKVPRQTWYKSVNFQHMLTITSQKNYILFWCGEDGRYATLDKCAMTKS